ncbi:putative WD40 repeat-containing protein [Leptomonas pyrrhocoris]|uniref:Putative WD40 repeat-containing protein n=1 Tax=Leptomonas pyrrhocoris TaxID=157538 RepID=A0A0N0VDR0_LEPPY|nr:putative WD40 repeat-containing protein [Leptomonas pyrrhocoris]KPA75924.1 putative WD40 repeat-containing protein [Leptomonas pyrrhocoris]|eukprot:XP_015654363.1 putative WD40 repeat-containing protein [Leptomonas pyrrhocoris]
MSSSSDVDRRRENYTEGDSQRQQHAARVQRRNAVSRADRNTQDASPLSPPANSATRTARRPPRPRTSEKSNSPLRRAPLLHFFPSSPNTSSSTGQYYYGHDDDDDDGDDGSGEEESDSGSDRATSLDATSSVLSTAMYHPERGQRHFFDSTATLQQQQQSYDAQDTPRAAASSSQVASSSSSMSSPRWPPAAATSPRGSPSNPAAEYVDAPQPIELGYVGDGTRPSPHDLHYCPPGHRGYRAAVKRDGERKGRRGSNGDLTAAATASSAQERRQQRADKHTRGHQTTTVPSLEVSAFSPTQVISAAPSSSSSSSATAARAKELRSHSGINTGALTAAEAAVSASLTATTTAMSGTDVIGHSISTQRSMHEEVGDNNSNEPRNERQLLRGVSAPAGQRQKSRHNSSGSSSSGSNGHHSTQRQPEFATAIHEGLRRRRGHHRSHHGAAEGLCDRSGMASHAAAHRTPLSRRPVVTWRSHARVCAVTSVASGQVLTGGDLTGVIEVWDSRTGRLLCGLSGHLAPVLSLLAIPNTSLLLSGSADRTARLWELRTLQNTKVLEGHRGLVTALATLSMPDIGLNLFTGSDDGTVRQWRAATGACVHVYGGHHGPVNVVASLRSVKYIATGGSDGVLKIWNAQTLRCVSSTAAVPAATTAAIHSRNAGDGPARWGHDAMKGGSTAGGAVWDIVQLSDTDQSIAVATGDGAVRLWASHWHQQAVLLKEIYLPGLLLKARSGARCLLACGTHLCVGGARGELYLWDTDSLPYVSPPVNGGDRRAGTTSARPALSLSLSGSGGGGTFTSGGRGGHHLRLSSPAGTVVAAGGGCEAGEGGDAQAELFAASLLFHTAAITGLTRQGAQLYSSSLDHTVCRWDLHGLVMMEGEPAMDLLQENGLAMGLAFTAEQGWSSPFSWAMRPLSNWAWGAAASGGGGARGWGQQGMQTGLIESCIESGSGSRGGGVVVDGAAVGSSEAWSRLQQQQQQQQQHLLLQSVAKAPFSSPLALLRNPKSLLVSDAAAAAREEGEAAATSFTELSPGEAAAAYTELPLTFLVGHLRSAAVSPVDVRTVAKAFLLLLYIVFFVVFYCVGLAPLVRQGNDLTHGLLSQTAAYPLPSFAQPRTFASITNAMQLERWVMLMMNQLHTLSVPVDILLPANTAVEAPVVPGKENASSSGDDGSGAGTGRDTGTKVNAHSTLLELPAMPGGLVLLRHVRVRVKHVTNTSCRWNPHFIRRLPTVTNTTTTANVTSPASVARLPCYGELRRSTESRVTLCPGHNAVTTETNLTGLLRNISGRCVPYTSVLAGVPFSGLFNRYDAGGYILNLPFYVEGSNASVLHAPIEAMRRVRLVDDQRTRLVDALLFTYHIHTRTFVRLHYALEIPRGGAWFPSTDTRPCPLFDDATSSHAQLTMACVVLMFVLLLLLLGLVLYDMVMAYFVGELLSFFLSAALLVEVACVTLGLCVVGFCFQWIVVSRAVDTTGLLRASAPAEAAVTVDNLLASYVPPAYETQIHQLNTVAIAFSSLATCVSTEAVLLFLAATVTVSRLITFMQIVAKAMRQIRAQVITAAAMTVLLIVSFALALHLLFGSRHYAYSTIGRSLWQLLLYLAASQSVNADVDPLIEADRRDTGKGVLLAFNYLCRVFCYVYLVALVVERVQGVARETPHISMRALLAKWWYDVQYQQALVRQRAPDTVMSGNDHATAATAAEDGRHTHQRGVWSSLLSTTGHRRVVIEHVWRRLRSLQQEQEEEAQHRQQQQAAAAAASPLYFLDRQEDISAFYTTSTATTQRRRPHQRLRARDSASSAARSTAAAAADDPAAAPSLHVQLRLTDLLLLLSEEERTPFARNVIRHVWDSLAWMYHCHQQHTRAQNPAEAQRRARLNAGIYYARLRLEPLLAVVRATQARLEAHEARLRPLAKAVEAMATGKQ